MCDLASLQYFTERHKHNVQLMTLFLYEILFFYPDLLIYLIIFLFILTVKLNFDIIFQNKIF